MRRQNEPQRQLFARAAARATQSVLPELRALPPRHTTCCGSTRNSKRPSRFQSAAQRHLIGELKISPNRQTACRARDL